MKKLFFYCTVLLLGGLYACSEDEVFTTTAIDKSKALVKSEILNDTIIPLEGNRDTLKGPPQTRSSTNIQEELSQLEDVPIFLKIQGNSTSKQFLNVTDAGTEATIAEYSGDINQQFYIKIPSSIVGIPYLIYSKKTNTPLKIGAYTSNPATKVLYADKDNNGGTFGASWDFEKGEYTPNSFVISAQDYPQQGSSGNWMDIYYPVITVEDAKISFSKYNNSPRQEFAIVPAEEFTIESIKYNIDAADALKEMPDIVFVDRYINKGPIEQTHKFVISETYKETSNFSRKTSYDVKVSATTKVKVPLVASAEINVSTEFGQEFVYGESDEHTIAINREYPVVVPANYKAELKLVLLKYNMDVEYVATCRGVTSGKKLEIKGRWTGVDVVETEASTEFTPLNGGPTTRVVISENMLNSRMPIKIQ